MYMYNVHVYISFPVIHLQRESIAETRRIKEQQDLEYQEGLRSDMEKAEKAREEWKRVEVCLSHKCYISASRLYLSI